VEFRSTIRSRPPTSPPGVRATGGRWRSRCGSLAAVGQGLARHPIAGPDGQYLARFQISAARSVTPLDHAPVTDPLTNRRLRGVVPKMRFHFDESSGKMTSEKPFTQQLHTDVKLLSLTPIP
jgi:hypothetical protein